MAPMRSGEGVGRFIERRRKELGLSQREVAARADMGETSLNRMVNARKEGYEPSIDIAERLARALECSVWDVMRAAGWPVDEARKGAETTEEKLNRHTSEIETMDDIPETAKEFLRLSYRNARETLRRRAAEDNGMDLHTDNDEQTMRGRH